MVIQELKPSKRVRGRWLAVLEDGSILRLGENEIIDFALCAGKELTEEEAEGLMASLHRSGLKEKALSLLARKPQSRKELERKLSQWEATQEEAAAQMGVARTTVQRIYAQARRKLAVFLVEGRPLQIGGGSYALCPQESCRGVSRPCGRCASQDGKEASS